MSEVDSSLCKRLRFVKVEQAQDSHIIWPCLHFETYSGILSSIKMNPEHMMQLSLAFVKRSASRNSAIGPVAFLLGKGALPNQMRCIWSEDTELLDFAVNLPDAFTNFKNVPGFMDAMQETAPYLSAGTGTTVEKPSVTRASTENQPAAHEENSSPSDTPVAAVTEMVADKNSNVIASVTTTTMAMPVKKLSIAAVPEANASEASVETNAAAAADAEITTKANSTSVRRSRSTSVAEAIAAEATVEPKADVAAHAEPNSAAEPVNDATGKPAPSPSKTRSSKPARVSVEGPQSLPTPMETDRDSETSTTSSTATKKTGTNKRKAQASTEKSTNTTQAKKKRTVALEDMIPTFDDVRADLKKQNYVFRDDLYCRPGMDPKKNHMAMLGTDYFKDEQLFRENLCAFGVDGKFPRRAEGLIRKWVRHSIAKSIYGKDELPDHEPLSGNGAIRLLRRIGFKFFTTLTSGYALPGVAANELVNGQNHFEERGQRGLWVYLARFGLPSSCALSELTAKELCSLELYLCEHDEIETFGRLNVDANGMIVSEDSPSHSELSSGRASRTSRKKVVEADSLTVITADSTAQKGAGKKPGTGKKKGGSKPAKASTAKKPRIERAITPVNRKLAFSREADEDLPTKVAQSPVLQWGPSPLPIIEGTAQEKLTTCLEALKQTHAAENNSFYRSGSQFASNLKTILAFVAASIASRGENGGNEGDPTALYVCGIPGIGKTSGVKWCCAKAVEQASRNRTPKDPDIKVIHINGGFLSSATSPMTILLNELAKGTGMKNPGAQKTVNILKRIKSQNMVVVVLDEIDLLVGKASTSVEGTRLLGAEGVVQTLLEWAGNEEIPIALIGISNSSANPKYDRLHKIGKFKNTVMFNAYSKNDLVGIVQARIGDRVVAPKALEFIALKIEQSTGDARKVLEMMADAIERRLSALLEGKRLPSDPEAPLVTLGDVLPIIKERNNAVADKIEGLPAMGKAILCVLTSLAKVSVNSTSLFLLKRFTMQCMSQCDEHQEEMLTTEDFTLMIETLVQTGLLTTGGDMKRVGPANLASMPISLSVGLEDVEIAINNGIGQERFYANIINYTKENKTSFVTKVGSN